MAKIAPSSGVGEPWRRADHEAQQLAASLRRVRLTVLHGDAGSGKSMLLAAGVLPLLRRRASDLPRPPDQPPRVVVPFPDRRNRSPEGRRDVEVPIAFDQWTLAPLKALNQRLNEALGLPRATGDEGMASWAARLQTLARRHGVRFVFIFDRFEQVLAAPRERGDLLAFVDAWIEAVTRPGLPANFLVSLDEGAWIWLERLRERLPGFDDHAFRLQPQRDGSVALVPTVPQPHDAAPAAAPAGFDASLDEALARVAQMARGDAGTTGPVEPEVAIPVAVPNQTPAPSASIPITRVPLLRPALVRRAPVVVPAPVPVAAPAPVPEAPEPVPQALAPAVDVVPPAAETSPPEPALEQPEPAAPAAPERPPLDAPPEDDAVRAEAPPAATDPVAEPLSAETYAAVATEPPAPLAAASPDRRRIDVRRNWPWAAAAAVLIVLFAYAFWPSPSGLTPEPMAQAPAPTPAATPPRAAAPAAPVPVVARFDLQIESPDDSHGRIARDLARALAPSGVALRLVPAAPGADLLLGLKGDGLLAMARYDALQAVRRIKGAPPLQVVAPLFTEEILFIARADSPLAYIHDIRGKRINVGPPEEAAARSAGAVYQRMFGTEPGAPLGFDRDQALAELVGFGSIDVMAVVDPQPSAWLATLAPETLRAIKILKLDPSNAADKRALQAFLPLTWRASTDGTLPATPTLGVMSFLVATGSGADAEHERALGELAKALCTGLPSLRSGGHPKWREVQTGLQLDAGWPEAPAAQAALRACAS